ncbi:hypothetical protein KIW84_055085 [Lathyrus oleraceus]|uniref:Uncharacterized protein n=1 Tax=Pisum sativum TaxID=3888 RepID=A0A9D4WX40_PEA|nr:hypothetical protein KIW84_055085 [Pisum sativum]
MSWRLDLWCGAFCGGGYRGQKSRWDRILAGRGWNKVKEKAERISSCFWPKTIKSDVGVTRKFIAPGVFSLNRGVIQGGAGLFAAVAIAARNQDGIASSSGGDGIRVSNDELEEGKLQDSQVQLGSNFTTFQDDPIVDKLRTQLGVIHPIPSPPINGNIAEKPGYVERVEIKQFSLRDEPLSVRNVERRTSRRVNDLQYQIGLRYTGGARMLLSLSLKFGIIPIVVPVDVRDFDIDGDLGFLMKLLTVDLPRLFVRPNKIVLDFQKGKAIGPVTVGPVADGVKD